MPHESQSTPKQPRRQFLADTSLLCVGAAAVATTGIARAAHSYGDETIRVGLVGCGGRGSGAIDQILSTPGPVKLVAVADAFQDRIDLSLQGLAAKYHEQATVPPDHQYAGFDGYQRVIEHDLDLIVLATPPGFRPLHFEAAVAAGRHIFMEKPVAVDAPGVRRVLAANAQAKAKGLMVAVGLQRHHESNYRETIQRLHDGAIGDIILGRAYWNSSGVWTRPREPGMTEMEYQMRNWYYFNWLCGDHIVEQHIHNLDVINWLMNDYPVVANGQGGREVRKGPDHGQIFDHHFVEFTYANGAKMYSQCRHIEGCWNEVSEFAHGTKGTAQISGGRITDLRGNKTWAFDGRGENGHLQEQIDLIASLRRGEIYNEGDFGAMSTMTAILGRMVTYSGQVIKMEDALASDLVESPVDQFHSFDDVPPVVPDAEGRYPVPVPGRTTVLASRQARS